MLPSFPGGVDGTHLVAPEMLAQIGQHMDDETAMRVQNMEAEYLALQEEKTRIHSAWLEERATMLQSWEAEHTRIRAGLKPGAVLTPTTATPTAVLPPTEAGNASSTVNVQGGGGSVDGDTSSSPMIAKMQVYIRVCFVDDKPDHPNIIYK